MNYQTRVRLGDIKLVTRGEEENTGKIVYNSDKKSEFYLKETTWLGHEKHENRMRLNRKNFEAIPQLKLPTLCQEIKSLLVGLQYFAKFIPKFFKKYRRSEIAFEKKNEMDVDSKEGRFHLKKKENCT